MSQDCSKCAWTRMCTEIMKRKLVPEGSCPVEFCLGWVLGKVKQEEVMVGFKRG